jgi:hypothetical protein
LVKPVVLVGAAVVTVAAVGVGAMVVGTVPVFSQTQLPEAAVCHKLAARQRKNTPVPSQLSS